MRFNMALEKGKSMSKKSKTRSIGRDAATGQFIPVDDARKRPNTTVVERISLPKKGK